jgi:2-dehydro-3-deoxyphosphogluconate aldolase/(4S)-4-hydroxy-2-oxoglutarate aldolase
MSDILLRNILSKKILPAIVFNDEEDAVRVAAVFLEAGLNVIEVPFRTPAAPEAIARIRKTFPEMYTGAGTLLSPVAVQQAIYAGAQFGLSAGLRPSVCEKALEKDFPFIPGVMTSSEIEQAAAMGLHFQKVFPINLIGGADYIKAIQEPYEQLGVQFIPMGGINSSNMKEYLQLRTVVAVGGSWIAPKELIAQKNFKGIEPIVRKALALIN